MCHWYMVFGVVLAYLLVLLTVGTLAAGDLFQDLALVEEIDRDGQDRLPFFYNFTMVGGYFAMPSARTPRDGVLGVGVARVHPYNIYNLSFQILDRLELSGNYRVFTGRPDPLMGKSGFGDEAERAGNVKFIINLPEDGYPDAPSFAIGLEDFLGTKRFSSEYAVATQVFKRANLEMTLGWGRKRLNGWFGGFAWTPLRKKDIFFLNNISLIAEWDAYDYKHHVHEHPKGRDVKSRINLGFAYVGGDTLQLSMSSIRGKHIAMSGSLRYPFGTSEGLLKKSQNPVVYKAPVDTEPLGVIRPMKQFAHELGYALGDQGIDVYGVWISNDAKTIWVKIINNSYRQSEIVRERLQRVLAAITPSDVSTVIVTDEALGMKCYSYTFRTQDLYQYRTGIVGDFELETVAPMKEAASPPKSGEFLFKRSKHIWLTTFRPRILTFFGSSTGKIKYNLGLILTPEGYLFDDIYYEAQAAYDVQSSMANLSAMDRLNPSKLRNVRTDTIKYFQTNTVALEMAYLQKTWNFGKGFYGRIAGGYFEPAYGGLAWEALYYPVNSGFAIGIEQATLPKRQYKGFAFTNKVRRLRGSEVIHEKFLGNQYFLTLYYTIKRWDIDIKIQAGQFLAKDKGARFEVARWFQSGLKVSFWVTTTNGHDHINGRRYFDKGFAFELPLDFFLRKSSRSYMGYAMSAWLRDVGAVGETGRGVYNTLRLERK